MNNNFARLAAAVTLAFATAAGTGAFATPVTNSNDNAQPAAPTGPAKVPYAAATPPAVLLGCTKDQHALRMLVVPGAPVADIQAGNVPAHEFLSGLQEAMEAPLSALNKTDLEASEENLVKINQSMNEFIRAFNALHESRLALAVLDYGVTNKPDPACAPKPVTPQP